VQWFPVPCDWIPPLSVPRRESGTPKSGEKTVNQPWSRGDQSISPLIWALSPWQGRNLTISKLWNLNFKKVNGQVELRGDLPASQLRASANQMGFRASDLFGLRCQLHTNNSHSKNNIISIQNYCSCISFFGVETQTTIRSTLRRYLY
jgi:hypothetical protein